MAFADWRPFLPKTVTVLGAGDYGLPALRSDIVAGLVVAIVALPLAMALAIASGTTPAHGLITAVVAGFLISLLGGSRFQIGGPTGAFVVIVYGVIARQGYDGLLMATMMAGAILIIAGFLRVGALIKYIPDPVTAGFTSGIAVVIMTSQIKDLFGLTLASVPADFVPKLMALWGARATLSLSATALAGGCLAAILLMRRFAPKAPYFLIVTVAAGLVVALGHLPVETIGTRFGGVPSSLPVPNLAFWSWEKARAVLPSALTIALLAGVESLLSAVVADQMSGARHRSNAELVAQGVANIASSLFGGLPATGAIARTATNIRSGARSPLAGMAHAGFLLAFMLLLAPLMKFVPLAALAPILVVVAWNMAEVHRFGLILRTSNGDRAVLLATFALTVIVDLTVAIEVGVVLAALVFMHRMARLASIEGAGAPADGAGDEAYAPNGGLPSDVGVITFRGPLFFGSASALKDTLDQIGERKRRYILRMEETPMMDPSGAFALGDFLKRALAEDAGVIVCGARPGVVETLRRSLAATVFEKLRFSPSIDEARGLALQTD
jgi:SulP family sulfate permease